MLIFILFSIQDFCNDRNYISEETRVLLLTGKVLYFGVLQFFEYYLGFI